MKSAQEQIKELENLYEQQHEDYDNKHKIRQVITKIKQSERLGGYLDNTCGYVDSKYADLITQTVKLDVTENIVDFEPSLTIGARIHKNIFITCSSIEETLRVYELISTCYTLVVFNRDSKNLVGILYEDGCE